MACWAWSRSAHPGSRPRPCAPRPARPWAGSPAHWRACGPSHAGGGWPGRHPAAPPTAPARHRRPPPPAPASHGAAGPAATPPRSRWTRAPRQPRRPVPWCRRRARPRSPDSTAGPAPAAPGSGCRRPRRTHSPDPTGHAGRTPGSRPASWPAADQRPRLTAPPRSRRTPPGPARSRRWTARAGTAAAAPQPPWGSCGTRAAGSPTGTGPARPSPGRPGDRPLAARVPGSHRPQSSPRAGGRGRCGPPAAGHPRHARQRARPGSRRPRPPRRQPACAWRPHGPARPDPRVARYAQPHRPLIRKSTVSGQVAASGAAKRSRVQAGSMDGGQAAGSRVTL
jgi:hypothetical protein